MMVFIEKNLVFLSMPKTASTAFIAALTPYASMMIKSPPGVKHMNLRRFDNRLRPVLEKSQKEPLETMAVIRHPIDWLGSSYRYRQRDKIENTPNSTKDVSFDTFVQAYMSHGRPILPKLAIKQNFCNLQNRRRQLHICFNMKINPSLCSF